MNDEQKATWNAVRAALFELRETSSHTRRTSEIYRPTEGLLVDLEVDLRTALAAIREFRRVYDGS